MSAHDDFLDPDIHDPQDELDEILEDMDVPAMRMRDMGWLNRNLGVRNGDHPDFKRAMELIKDSL